MPLFIYIEVLSFLSTLLINEHSPLQSEDKCLFSCLVKKFTAEFDCIHPRLALMSDAINITQALNKVLVKSGSFWVIRKLIGEINLFRVFNFKLGQGILKGEVSLYSWPPIWLVWNQLCDNWQFSFLFAKLTNSNRSNRRSTVQWYFPL